MIQLRFADFTGVTIVLACAALQLGSWLTLATAVAVADESAVVSGGVVSGSSVSDNVLLKVRRGLGAEVEFSHPSSSLMLRTDMPTDGPVLARLELLGSVGGMNRGGEVEGSGNVGEYRYLLRFFGTEAGRYNLATYLVIEGQSRAERGNGIDPLWVQVISDLPVERGSDLYELDDPELFSNAGYRRWATALVGVWALIPIVVFLSRNRRTEVREIQANPIVPSDRERLGKLLQSSSRRVLDASEKAELEWLLCVCLAEKRELPRSLIAALPQLRREPALREHLVKLERLLHSSDSTLPSDEHLEYKQVLNALGIEDTSVLRDGSSMVSVDQHEETSGEQITEQFSGGRE